MFASLALVFMGNVLELTPGRLAEELLNTVSRGGGAPKYSRLIWVPQVVTPGRVSRGAGKNDMEEALRKS